jgi:hypothetical protein
VVRVSVIVEVVQTRVGLSESRQALLRMARATSRQKRVQVFVDGGAECTADAAFPRDAHSRECLTERFGSFWKRRAAARRQVRCLVG